MAAAVARRLQSKWKLQSGIGPEEIKEIRSRGPKQDAQGNYIPTTQSEVVVPTRSRDAYRAPAQRGAEYEKEETEKGEWRRNWKSDVRTKYHRGEDQEKHRLEVTDQKVKRSGSPGAADTTKSKGGTFGRDDFASTGREIFAMDTAGNVFAKDPERWREEDAPDQVKVEYHTSLVHGEPVIGAGEIRIKDGVVEELTEMSGHYKPSPAQMADTVNELEAQGFPMIDPETQRWADVRLAGKHKADKDEAAAQQLAANVNARIRGERPPVIEAPAEVKMSFETFSQTGGNLEQIERKKEVLREMRGEDPEMPSSEEDRSDAFDSPVQVSPDRQGEGAARSLPSNYAERQGADGPAGTQGYQTVGQSAVPPRTKCAETEPVADRTGDESSAWEGEEPAGGAGGGGPAPAGDDSSAWEGEQPAGGGGAATDV